MHASKSLMATMGAVLAALVLGAVGRGDQQLSTREVMRTKLQLAQGVLEGMTTENFGLVTTNAQRLRSLSNAAGWRLRSTPQYQQFTADYARAAESLERAAGARNADRATLAYFQLTTSCVNCHRYLRGGAEANWAPRDVGKEMAGRP